MKTNKVACFYTELKNVQKFTKQCRELIDYWKKSWSKNGWEPYVLTEDYVKEEEYYKLLEFDNFNESNLCKHSIDFHCEYTRACYLRWLAYYKFAKEHGDILWCDYDVINYQLTPDNDIKVNKIISNCCSAGKLNEEGGNRILQEFTDVQKGEYDFKTLARLINKHPDERLKYKFSDMMLNKKLVGFKIHRPLIAWNANEKVVQTQNPPFLIHYHNGIFSKNPNNKNCFSAYDYLHIDGERCSRLEAIKILEEINNIETYD